MGGNFDGCTLNLTEVKMIDGQYLKIFVLANKILTGNFDCLTKISKISSVKMYYMVSCSLVTLWSWRLASCSLGWRGLTMQCGITISLLLIVIKLVSSLNIFVC